MLFAENYNVALIQNYLLLLLLLEEVLSREVIVAVAAFQIPNNKSLKTKMINDQ